MLTSTFTPACAADVCEIVADASAHNRRLRIRGGGSKDLIGAPTPGAPILLTGAMNGIQDYDPPELVLTAGAGTPLADIETALAAERQMLAFEPCDAAGALGGERGTTTIGGVIASGLAGSRRLAAGGVRDHLLGFEAVSGRGEHFKAGAKVVKNVTGFDLPKVMAGSWGRLAVLTSVTLKVLPLPESKSTVVIDGLEIGESIAAMARALGSPANVAAAAKLPATPSSRSRTLFRLEGFPASIASRVKTLRTVLGDSGRQIEPLAANEADDIWRDISSLSVLPAGFPTWRIVVAPSDVAQLISRLGSSDWFLDWAGGLLWLASDADAGEIRASTGSVDGTAMLFRGPESLRKSVPALHPPAATLAQLEARVRGAFDPDNVFDTGRF